MYPLFETICIQEGVPLHSEWHQRRIDYAFHLLFGMNNPMEIKKVIRIPDAFRNGTVKCRFLYDTREYETEFSAYTPREIASLRLVHADGLDYSHKFTNREAIGNLLGQKGTADDILIVRDGLITDTSYTNILFFDGKNWITPKDPLLEGTCRNRLLAEKKIIRADIRPEELNRFTSFLLINAMLGFNQQKDLPIDRIAW